MNIGKGNLPMNMVLKSLIEPFEKSSTQKKKQVLRELFQEVVLSGLSKWGFFGHAAFYGGTALRILHGLPRYSEDLDFTLLAANKEFDFAPSYLYIKNEFAAAGFPFEVECGSKDKKVDSNIGTSMVSINCEEAIRFCFGDIEGSKVVPNEKIRIKVEADLNPPLGFNPAAAYVNYPFPSKIMTLDLPSLFAGKIAACLLRKRGNRVKGRDFFDYSYLIGIHSKVNLRFLKSKLVRAGAIDDGKDLTIEDVKDLMREKIRSIDWDSAKEDVNPFVDDPRYFDCFDSGYFLSITERLEEEA